MKSNCLKRLNGPSLFLIALVLAGAHSRAVPAENKADAAPGDARQKAAAGSRSPSSEKKEEPPVFWPFSPKDDEILFGPKGARGGFRSNDPIFLWQRTVREFSDKREKLQELSEEQEQIFEQLAQMSGVLLNGKVTAPNTWCSA